MVSFGSAEVVSLLLDQLATVVSLLKTRFFAVLSVPGHTLTETSELLDIPTHNCTNIFQNGHRSEFFGFKTASGYSDVTDIECGKYLFLVQRIDSY